MVKATPTKAPIQVAHVPVSAIASPDSNRNKELRIMNKGLEAVKICMTINGRCSAKIAVVEKIEPVGVNFKLWVQTGGKIFTPA